LNTAAYLDYLRKLGVELRCDGEQLVCNAPKGTLTPEIRATLADRKDAILTFLRRAGSVVTSATSKIEATQRDGFSPLSFAQERLWYLDQLEPSTATYNIPSAFRLAGVLQMDALRQSLNEVINRHEILRTSFVVVNNAPVQSIAPSLELELPLVDLSELAETKREQELSRILQREAERPFDLAKGPLVNAIVVRLQETEHVFFFMAHHTVFDGSSLGILLHELTAFYDASVAGKLMPVLESPIQYADYTVWQRKWLDGEELERQLTYWRKQLEDEVPNLQMPTCRSRPPKQSYRGSVELIQLSKNLVDALAELGRQDGATLYMVLLAAFNVLLYRYSNQDDVVVGSPINNRNRPEIESAIGFFVNTLVLRTSLSGDPSFRELLARVRETCLNAYSHQDLPFEKLVQALQPKRDLSRTPLFQVLFAFQDTSDRVIRSTDLSWTAMRVNTHVARTDLSFWLTQTESGLAGALEYSTDLFDQATIKRLLQHFEKLLEGILADPDESVSKYPILRDTEREQLLVEWNATQSGYPKDRRLHELFEAQAQRTPESVAVVFEDTQLTYAELNRRANQVAHHLQAAGVGAETLVGICLTRSLEMMVGLLGILKAGGAYLPLDPDFPKDLLAFMLSDADVSMLLTEERLLAELPEHKAQIVCLDADKTTLAQQSSENPDCDGTPDNLAYVIYTSGSTGRPKGVQVPHRAVVNFLKSMQQEPGIAESDRLLAVTTLSFDIAVLELFLPLTAGASVVVASREVAADGNKLLETLQEAGITIMQATPASWSLLLTAGWDGTPPIKVLCGGEAMLPDLAFELLKRGESVWNLYGPTETTIWSTCYELSDPDGPVLIGRPIANTQVYVLDCHGQPVPNGVTGELYIGGVGVTRGYLQRPELTTERFVPDIFAGGDSRLYRTGDLARWRADGLLEHLGRIDSQVKVRGFRIELGEIEAVLSEHASVSRVALTVWEAGPGDQRLVAHLVPTPGTQLVTTELRKYLGSKLPDYMVPQHYVELEEMPLTPNGKVDRKQLSAPKVVAGGNDQQQQPDTDAEKLVANIWSSLLGVDNIGRHDNFFELGGHSLLAVKAVVELEKASGTRVELRYLLLEDLVQIALHIQGRSAANEASGAYEGAGLFRRMLNWTQQR